MEEQDQSWTLTAVHQARMWSFDKDLRQTAYILTRKVDPFHHRRAHGVLEVRWDDRTWVTAVALPKWINSYHCLGLLKNVCGPMLDHCCAMWCDGTQLGEELTECNIGSFLQVHIKTELSDLVRLDLQAALQRSIYTMHLPVKRLRDNEVMMQVFVPHGVTCFSGTTFACLSKGETWREVLLEAGKRAYPRRKPESLIFYKVHSAIEEVSSLHDPVTKHFVLADTEEQMSTRAVVFAVFTTRYEFIGACHWTRVTQLGDITDLCGEDHGWVVYHNNHRLQHHKVSVSNGDFFACYERCDGSLPRWGDFPSSGAPQATVPARAFSSLGVTSGPVEPTLVVADGVDITQSDSSLTFEQTRDPMLLIGQNRRTQLQKETREVHFDLRSFQ